MEDKIYNYGLEYFDSEHKSVFLDQLDRKLLESDDVEYVAEQARSRHSEYECLQGDLELLAEKLECGFYDVPREARRAYEDGVVAAVMATIDEWEEENAEEEKVDE